MKADVRLRIENLFKECDFLGLNSLPSIELNQIAARTYKAASSREKYVAWLSLISVAAHRPKRALRRAITPSRVSCSAFRKLSGFF